MEHIRHLTQHAAIEEAARKKTVYLRHLLYSLYIFAALAVLGTIINYLLLQIEPQIAFLMTVGNLLFLPVAEEIGSNVHIPLAVNVFFHMTGLCLLVYMIGALMGFIMEGEASKLLEETKLKRRVEKMSDHFIICGFGRLGSSVAKHLVNKNLTVTIIEINAAQVEHGRKQGFAVIHGDSCDRDVLMLAGISRAKGLIAALGEDSKNILLILTARELNYKLRIIAKANHPDLLLPMKAAGADETILPYTTAAILISDRILQAT